LYGFAGTSKMNEPMEFTIGEVAAMVGVSPHTIRAWERRHHVLNPQRTASRQRRYTPEDVELLLQVRRRVSAQGLSLKIAVQAAQGLLSVPAEDSFLPPSRIDGFRRPVGSTALGASPAADVLTPPEPPWRAVADLLPQPIVVLDGQGAVVEANQAASRLLAEPLERLAGRPFLDWLDGVDTAREAHTWQAPFERSRDRNLRLKTAGGEIEVRCDLLPFTHQGKQRLAVIAASPARQPVQPLRG
jgi:DNA-binding transcriptional MerR regulator